MSINSGSSEGPKPQTQQPDRNDPKTRKLQKVINRANELKLKKQELALQIRKLEDDTSLENEEENEIKVKRIVLEIQKIDNKIADCKIDYDYINNNRE
jgi:hypothetical protein